MENMKLLIIASLSLFGLFGFSSWTQAEALQAKITSFSNLPKLVKKIGNPTATLIVMDDDDTLTMMPCDVSHPAKRCQYLGGPAWYSWQNTLLQNYLDRTDDSPYRVADNQQQLFDIASLLLAINNMDYTESVIPEILTDMTTKGVRLMVETARGNSDVSATNSQFTNLTKGTANFSKLISSSAPIFNQANTPSLASPFYACNIPGYRAITYRQGVMYVSGQNKGILLKCLLNQYNEEDVENGSAVPVIYIIFVDDTLQNVTDVYDAFKHEKNYHVHALHYTALQDHKTSLTKGENKSLFQKTANERWQAIKSSLQTNLLQPNLGGE